MENSTDQRKKGTPILRTFQRGDVLQNDGVEQSGGRRRRGGGGGGNADGEMFKQGENIVRSGENYLKSFKLNLLTDLLVAVF